MIINQPRNWMALKKRIENFAHKTGRVWRNVIFILLEKGIELCEAEVVLMQQLRKEGGDKNDHKNMGERS